MTEVWTNNYFKMLSAAYGRSTSQANTSGEGYSSPEESPYTDNQAFMVQDALGNWHDPVTILRPWWPGSVSSPTTDPAGLLIAAPHKYPMVQAPSDWFNRTTLYGTGKLVWAAIQQEFTPAASDIYCGVGNWTPDSSLEPSEYTNISQRVPVAGGVKLTGGYKYVGSGPSSGPLKTVYGIGLYYAPGPICTPILLYEQKFDTPIQFRGERFEITITTDIIVES